jgi:hypothetical protein
MTGRPALIPAAERPVAGAVAGGVADRRAYDPATTAVVVRPPSTSITVP